MAMTNSIAIKKEKKRKEKNSKFNVALKGARKLFEKQLKFLIKMKCKYSSSHIT